MLVGAIDTNVLVRLLIGDEPSQLIAARELIRTTAEQGDDLLIPLGVLLESEWVLRSRYRLDKDSIWSAFEALLAVDGLMVEDREAVEESLSLWAAHARVDFAECLFIGRSLSLQAAPLHTFDAAAAQMPGAVGMLARG